jgi:enoyl-CoA hydratase/carnithine racemase
MTGSSDICLQREGSVATLRVGTGRRANALGSRDWNALATVADRLAEDPSVSVVVVTGRGDHTFSAGSDMREWLGADPHHIDEAFATMERALTAIERLPVPVIAQVRGAAVGAGCQLACACDLRIICDDARMGMPVARWGILVPPAFAGRLALLTGPARARDLLYTGRLVAGAEAVEMGLASVSVSSADLESTTVDVIESIAAHPPQAIRAAKRSVDSVLAPVRDHVAGLPQGPNADYTSMQAGLSAFLAHVTGGAPTGASSPIAAVVR